MPSDTPNARGKGAKPGSLGALIAAYKSAVTRQINQHLQLDGGRVWQSSYHDHIIRDEKSLNFIREYVLNNPARWAEDTFYVAEG